MTIDAAQTSAAPVADATDHAKPMAAMSALQASAALAARRAETAHAAPSPATATTEEADEGHAETATPDEELVEANTAEEGDDPTDETTDEHADEADDSSFEVEIGEEKVKLADLVEAWKRKNSFQRDYTKKTEALAEQRRALEAERAQIYSHVEKEREALAQQLQEAHALRERHAAIVKSWEDALATADKQWEQVDWDKLMKEDPFEAQRLWLQYERHKETKSKVQQQAEELRAQRLAEMEKMRAQQQALLAQHIQTKHPELLDPEKGPALANAMKSVAAIYGYSEQDMLATLDPRAIDMWIDATKWHQFQQEAQVASQKSNAPKPDKDGRIKIVKQQAAPRIKPPSPVKAAVGRAQAQFNRTLSDVDAANLLRARRAAASANGR